MSTTEEILKGRFAKRVFSETGADIEKAQTRYMSSRGFESAEWDDRSFVTSDSALVMQHRMRHRWVDMKTRQTKNGKKRKKNHAIHNKIMFGHYNNIVRDLKYGYTDAVIEELKSLEE